MNNETNEPGTTATVFRARNTRIVLSAAKLPSGNAIVIYLWQHHPATQRCSGQGKCRRILRERVP